MKEKIREENLRSIKSLNAYLDSVSQNKGVSAQSLRFYIADKQNKKAKKFFLIEINLDALKPQMTNESL
jgi:hypothetical protein